MPWFSVAKLIDWLKIFRVMLLANHVIPIGGFILCVPFPAPSAGCMNSSTLWLGFLIAYIHRDWQTYLKAFPAFVFILLQLISKLKKGQRER